MFLDSGSEVNIIDNKSYNLYFSHIPQSRSLVRKSLQSLNSSKFNVTGNVSLEVKVGEYLLTDDFYVVSNIGMHPLILIGYPSMAKHKIILNPERRGIIIQNKTFVPHTNKHMKTSVSHIVREIEIEVEKTKDDCERKRERERERDRERERERDRGRENSDALSRCDRVRESKQNNTLVSSRLNQQNVCNQEMSAVEKDDCPISLNLGEILNDNHIKPAYLCKDVEIGCEKPCVLAMKVKGVKDNISVVVLSEKSKVKGISATSSMSDIKDGKILVEVMNNTNACMQLRKGTNICDVEVYSKPIVVDEIGSFANVGAIMNTEIMNERLDKFKEKSNNIDFSEARMSLMDLLVEFEDIIALPNDQLGCTNILKHTILLKDKKPIYIPAYRIPEKHRQIVRKEVEDLLREGIVKPSSSPYNFPLLVVPKKDGTWRVVTDFRILNKVIIDDRFPVPAMEDIISSIGKKKYFSTIDLVKGYLQIPLDEDSGPYTAFSTDIGHYQYTRLPFGLKTAPITFMRLMNTIFSGLLGDKLFVYMDDLCICTNTLEEHVLMIREVLTRLRNANLKIKLSKCEFFKKEITYLGHKISGEGVEVHESKLKGIQSFPVPNSRKQLQSFLGVSGFYRKFVPGYSTIAAPLTDLLKKDADFVWSDEQQKAFESLKGKLETPPILVFPNFKNTFYLATDASNIGIGGVLMQKIDNKFRPLAYYSRKLKPNEAKLSVTDREALAVVQNLIHFKYIIMGHPIIIMTDHKPVLDLFNNPGHSPRRARMFMNLQDFDPQFKYIKGSSNIIADHLSRYVFDSKEPDLNIAVLFETNHSDIYNWDKDLIIKEQDEDQQLNKIKEYLREPSKHRNFKPFISNVELVDEVLVRKINLSTRSLFSKVQQIVIPKSLIKMALEIVHDNALVAHPGVDKTYEQARKQFYWKNMLKDIRKHIAECEVCLQYKGKIPNPPKILSYPVPEKPFDRVHMDLLTNFNETLRGNKHILVVVDYLTRYTELIPLSSKTAKHCASEFFYGYICRHGLPKTLISDNGKEFNNEFYSTLCNIFKIKKVNTSVYTPSSNGVVERTNRKILEILRTTIGGADTEWDLSLPAVQMTLNTSLHASIKDTPHAALYGLDCNSPFNISFSNDQGPLNDMQVVINNAKHRFDILRRKLEESNIELKKKQHLRAKTIDIKVGDLVYIKINVKKEINHKLGKKFSGPYRVIEKINNNKYKLQSSINESDIKHVHVSNIKPQSSASKERKKVHFDLRKNKIFLF